MKKADSLTPKITRDAKTVAGVPAGDGMPARSGRRDHVDAINQVFAELELAYHNQYHKAYGQEGSLNVAKKYWLECLAHFSPEIILQATRAVVTTSEYLPTVASIIQACEDAMTSHCMPSAHDAYVEACCAPNPKALQTWTHPVVFLAAKETGWFELANSPEARIFPLFEQHYRRLCQRALRGEVFAVEVPPTLPDRISRKLSAEENKKKMAELRRKLKTS